MFDTRRYVNEMAIGQMHCLLRIGQKVGFAMAATSVLHVRMWTRTNFELSGDSFYPVGVNCQFSV